MALGEKPVVLVDERYAQVLQAFPAEFDVRITQLADSAAWDPKERSARAVVTAGITPLPPSLFDLRHLGLIALIGSGFEAIDVADLERRGLVLTNTAGANSDDVATHAVSIFLALNRHILACDAAVRSGAFRDAVNVTPRSLALLNVGIVGLGSIGRKIADRLTPFGCDIAWWGPRPKIDAALPRHDSLLDLAAWCDVMFIAARAEASNAGLIDRTVIEAIGPSGVLVNISRGSIVDEDELVRALKDGRIAGAALDVFAQEPTPGEKWRGVPNTVLTPHLAARGDSARLATSELVFSNLRSFFAGEAVLTPLTAASRPSAHEPRSEIQ